MQFSGYDQKFRYHAMASAIKAHKTLKEKVRNGERPLYRPREWNADERRIDSDIEKQNWFKMGDCHAPIFLPATPNSILCKKAEEVIRGLGLKIWVVERSGLSLKRSLQRSNPFRPKTCDRENCLICRTGGSGNCNTSGINYNLVCMECDEEIRDGQYIGHTRYNGYTRGGSIWMN